MRKYSSARQDRCLCLPQSEEMRLFRWAAARLLFFVAAPASLHGGGGGLRAWAALVLLRNESGAPGRHRHRHRRAAADGGTAGGSRARACVVRGGIGWRRFFVSACAPRPVGKSRFRVGRGGRRATGVLSLGGGGGGGGCRGGDEPIGSWGFLVSDCVT